MQLPGAKGLFCRARGSEDVRRLWDGGELGLSERPVAQGEAGSRALLPQFPAAGMLAAAGPLRADTCITQPHGLFLFSRANYRAESHWIFF